jgi:hypothetical protein
MSSNVAAASLGVIDQRQMGLNAWLSDIVTQYEAFVQG